MRFNKQKEKKSNYYFAQNRFKSKNILGIVLSVCLIIAQTGCAGTAEKQDPVTKQSFYFDTVCSITIYDMKGMTQENAAAVIDDAFSLCSHYESLLSRTKEETDIYKINHADGEPVECDADTIEVLEKGIQYCELSGGKFDITIGRVTDLWDFHDENPAVPDEEELNEATSSVDYRSIVIDGNRVSLTNPGAEIDLGGVAKGFIADKVGDHLREEGVTSAIISLGGNIECVGSKLESGSTDQKERSSTSSSSESGELKVSASEEGEDTPFVVGIEKPFSDQTQIVGAVDAIDSTVVTSGVYERYFVEGGRLYHHILDATTGYPAQTDVIGVTIHSKDGNSADCDALATICTLLGSEEGMKLIDGLDGYEAAFIVTEDGSSVTTAGTGSESDSGEAGGTDNEAENPGNSSTETAVSEEEIEEETRVITDSLVSNEKILQTEGMQLSEVNN